MCSQCKILFSVGVMGSFCNFCLGHKPLVDKMISVTGCGPWDALPSLVLLALEAEARPNLFWQDPRLAYIFKKPAGLVREPWLLP